MASVRLRRGGEGGVLGVAATCDAGLFWGEGLRRRRVMGGDWIERDRDGVELGALAAALCEYRIIYCYG